MRHVVLAMLAILAAFGVPERASAQGGACTQQASDRWEYADFAGVWERHGMALDVDPRGCGLLLWRTYRSCSPDRVKGCDRPEGGVLGFGGHAEFVLDVHEGMAASGRIIDSSDWTDLGGGGIVLRLDEGGTLTAEWDDTPTTFCRPWLHNPMRCGA